MDIEKIKEQIILNNPKMFPQRARQRRKKRIVKMFGTMSIMCILLFCAFIFVSIVSPENKRSQSIIGYAEGNIGVLAQKSETENVLNEEAKEESEFIMPTMGRISSGFGEREDPFTGEDDFHSGLDIAANEGTPIYAAASGVVERAGTQELAGNYVVIDHDGGVVTKYFHCKELLVSSGDKVDTDTPIALVGSTGNSTGPHLHFEVYVDGVAVNPLGVIDD